MQAQEAAERKKEEEKAAKAKADAEAEAAAKAAAAVNAGGLKKKKSATILLKGAKMAFNATGASVTRQVSLNKVRYCSIQRKEAIDTGTFSVFRASHFWMIGFVFTSFQLLRSHAIHHLCSNSRRLSSKNGC